MDIHSVRSDTTTGSEEAESTSNTTNNSTSKARAVNSDTPQTMLSGDEDYASGAADTNSSVDATADASNNAHTSNTANMNGDSHVTGYQGNPSRLVMEYRASLINIDTQVLSSLTDCFMLILNSGDEYFARENGWYY
jgi:hypothetical protein